MVEVVQSPTEIKDEAELRFTLDFVQVLHRLATGCIDREIIIPQAESRRKIDNISAAVEFGFASYIYPVALFSIHLEYKIQIPG